jgi:hypothetical protein
MRYAPHRAHERRFRRRYPVDHIQVLALAGDVEYGIAVIARQMLAHQRSAIDGMHGDHLQQAAIAVAVDTARDWGINHYLKCLLGAVR